MSDTFTKLAYQTFQQGKSDVGRSHQAASTQLTNLCVVPSQQNSNPLPVELLLRPYFRPYTADNSAGHLEQAGSTDRSVDVHFMSKYLMTHKPFAPAPTAVLSEDGA